MNNNCNTDEWSALLADQLLPSDFLFSVGCVERCCWSVEAENKFSTGAVFKNDKGVLPKVTLMYAARVGHRCWY